MLVYDLYKQSTGRDIPLPGRSDLTEDAKIVFQSFSQEQEELHGCIMDVSGHHNKPTRPYHHLEKERHIFCPAQGIAS